MASTHPGIFKERDFDQLSIRQTEVVNFTALDKKRVSSLKFNANIDLNWCESYQTKRCIILALLRRNV